MKLHVSNLPPDITEEELKELFSQFGKVRSVNVFEYPDNSKKGYGFIDAPFPADNIENGLKQIKFVFQNKVNCRN